MICTLSGTFLSVAATYTHSSALGGAETSLIKSVNAYLFLHEVLDDLPGRDNIRDFLADTSGALDSINNLIPDSLYESDGGVYPVNMLTNATVTGSANPYQVNLTATVANWGYMRLTDPGQAKLPIASIVRSDGKVLNTNNYWTSLHYEPGSNFKDTYLNILDFVNLGNYTYAVTYTNPPPNTNAPVTTLMFAGPSTFTNGDYYVTPATQMYFLTQDGQSGDKSGQPERRAVRTGSAVQPEQSGNLPIEFLFGGYERQPGNQPQCDANPAGGGFIGVCIGERAFNAIL